MRGNPICDTQEYNEVIISSPPSLSHDQYNHSLVDTTNDFNARNI